MEITEFLEARIAEDEASVLNTPRMSDPFDARVAAYTPELRRRMAADCAAKRAIIKQAEEATSLNEYGISQSCINEAESEQARSEDPGMLILKALASVYKDHPDYQPEWAL